MKLRIRLMTSVTALVVGVLGSMISPATAATSRTIHLQLSNFRYCADSTTACTPADSAYVPDASRGGIPALGVYNPNAEVAVRPGDTVVWTYRDTGGCDAFASPLPVVCPGHEVWFAAKTTRTGFAASRSGVHTISYVVPTSVAKGTMLPYRCTLNTHYVFGMTGVLVVQ